jgi:hypothetical protein
MASRAGLRAPVVDAKMTGTAPVNAVRLDPRRVVVVLGAVAAVLLTAHLALVLVTAITGHDALFGLVRQFDLDTENNVPSFFSAGLFLLNALLLWLVGQVRRSEQRAKVWPFLAAVFIFLAYDEMFGIHERLVDPLRAAFHTSGVLRYPWVIVYAAPVIALVVWFLPAWRRLDALGRRALILSGTLYVLGAVGMEMMSGAYDEAVGGHTRTLAWGLLVAVEESLEMAGLISLVYALLTLLSRSAIGLPYVCVDLRSPVATGHTEPDR